MDNSQEDVFEADDKYYQSISYLNLCFNNLILVHLTRHLPTNSLVCMKRFNVERAEKNEISLIEQEIILTKQLQHPNILPYFTSYVSSMEICIISPLMGYGSCRDLIINHFTEGLPEIVIANVIKDVLRAVEYLHKKGIIHRAIRASHILIAENGRACLTGLRYACPIIDNGKWQKTIHSFPLSTVKNLNWLSPEVLEQNLIGYNEKSDIYSIGITCCELANGVVPFADVPTTLMLIEKVRGSAPQILDSTTFQFDEFNDTFRVPSNVTDGEASNSNIKTQQCTYSTRKISDFCHAFTQTCLERYAKDRPTATALLSHPFFKICRRSDYLPNLLHPVIPINEQILNVEELNELFQDELEDEIKTNVEWEF